MISNKDNESAYILLINLKMNFKLQFKGLSQAETAGKGLMVLKCWLETEGS